MNNCVISLVESSFLIPLVRVAIEELWDWLWMTIKHRRIVDNYRCNKIRLALISVYIQEKNAWNSRMLWCQQPTTSSTTETETTTAQQNRWKCICYGIHKETSNVQPNNMNNDFNCLYQKHLNWQTISKGYQVTFFSLLPLLSDLISICVLNYYCYLWFFFLAEN